MSSELQASREENLELKTKHEEIEKIALKYKQNSAKFECDLQKLEAELKITKEELDKSNKKVQLNELQIAKVEKGMFLIIIKAIIINKTKMQSYVLKFYNCVGISHRFDYHVDKNKGYVF